MSAPTASPATDVRAGLGGAALEGATCETLGDHRLALGLAVAGLTDTGVDVIDPRCAVVSDPEPWQHFQQSGGSVEGVVPA